MKVLINLTKVKLVSNPAYRNAVGTPQPVCDVVTEDGKVVAQFMFDRQTLNFAIILKETDGKQWCVDLDNLAALDFGTDPAQQFNDKTYYAMNLLASRLNLWIDWENTFHGDKHTKMPGM